MSLSLLTENSNPYEGANFDSYPFPDIYSFHAVWGSVAPAMRENFVKNASNLPKLIVKFLSDPDALSSFDGYPKSADRISFPSK